jgi:hypothetical protein
MNYYKVEYSYLKHDSISSIKYKTETYFTYNCQEAVEECRNEYSELHGFRIEQVWIDRNNRWEAISAWD